MANWERFLNLYKDTVADEYQVDQDELARANESLTQKRLRRKKVKWYPIFSDQPNAYQCDLMFEPYVNSKGEHILQALLCLVNVNTKYAFVDAVDYVKTSKENG
jgi:hypothetical protein